MSRTKSGPSMLTVAFHTFLVLITGGFWLIPLAIWFILNNKK